MSHFGKNKWRCADLVRLLVALYSTEATQDAGDKPGTPSSDAPAVPQVALVFIEGRPGT